MFNVHRLTVPRFLSNTYVVEQPEAGQALVVDPGDAAIGAVEALLVQLGVSVPYVILTHEHFDHIAGANALRERFGSRMICSAACAERARSPQKNMSRYLGGGDIVAGPPDLTCEEMAWQFGWEGSVVRFVHTPGHTPGSICIAMAGYLFSGDTLLDNVRTPTKLPEGSAQDLKQSVIRLVNDFPSDTLVYPGHGNPFPMTSVVVDTVLGKESTWQLKA